MFRRRKKSVEPQRVDLRLLSFQHIRIVGREQFEDALANVRMTHRFIMPGLLLLQLQFGTIDLEEIRACIMEFDDDSIGQALDALIKRGLQ